MPFISLLKALLSRKNPVYAHYGITHRCNLQCKMCFLWQKPGPEIPLEQIRVLALNLGKLGLHAISLGGGEPALREDLPEIFLAFQKQKINVRILTNGVLESQQPWERMFHSGLRDVSVSLDSPNPQTVDEICRREGAFSRVMESLEFFGYNLKRNRGLGLINTVVSRLNYRQLPELARLAGKSGFYLSLVPLEIQEFGGETLGCRDKMAEMLFTPEETKELGDVYRELLAIKAQGGKIFNSAAFLQLCRKNAGAKNRPFWPCLAGRLYFSLDPQGNFSICHRYKGYQVEPQTIPAYAPEFPALFKNSEYYKIASETAEGCPGCLRPCWAEVSLAFSHPQAFLERVFGALR